MFDGREWVEVKTFLMDILILLVMVVGFWQTRRSFQRLDARIDRLETNGRGHG